MIIIIMFIVPMDVNFFVVVAWLADIVDQSLHSSQIT